MVMSFGFEIRTPPTDIGHQRVVLVCEGGAGVAGGVDGGLDAREAAARSGEQVVRTNTGSFLFLRGYKYRIVFFFFCGVQIPDRWLGIQI